MKKSKKSKKIQNRIKEKKENILKLLEVNLEKEQDIDHDIKLRTFIERFPNRRSWGSALLNNSTLFASIIRRTNYIKSNDIFKNVAERIYHIQTELYSVPKCRCGKNLKFRTNGYSQFCSRDCANQETHKTRKRRIKLKKITGRCIHPDCNNFTYDKKFFCSKQCQLKFKNSGVSIDSQIIFESLSINLKIKNKSNYFLNFGEKFINNKYFVDFIFEDKIIEYYGDVWHANPKKFKGNDFPNPFLNLTSEKIWKKDLDRVQYLKNRGYDVLIIWESEWKEDKQRTLQKCSDFLGFEKKNFEIVKINRIKKQKKIKKCSNRICGEWLKGKTYEQIHGIKKATQLKKNKSGKNNIAAIKRKIIFPDGSEYLSHGDFENYCRKILNINPSTLRYHVRKGNKYKGFYFINLKESKK